MLQKERVSREKSEPKEGEQGRMSETQGEVKQEREGKHSIKGEERKESKKKSFLLRKCERSPLTMFSLLQGAEKHLVNTKPPKLPSFQGIKQPFIPKWGYKEHREFEFEPGNWVRVPGEHHYSDLRSNPFEEEENDATIVSVQSTILDPGGGMAEVHDERAETEEQTCHSAREKGEAIKMSN